MAYFPMFIDIEKKKCLVAGGGTVALRKVRVLLDFGAQVMVVAPQIDSQILRLTGNVCVKERTFEPEDLKDVFWLWQLLMMSQKITGLPGWHKKSIFRSMPWISRRTAVLFFRPI